MKSFAEPVAHVIYQVNNYSEWPQAGSLQPLAPHLNDHEICAERAARGRRRAKSRAARSSKLRAFCCCAMAIKSEGTPADAI
jgi:hypothetical protein